MWVENLMSQTQVLYMRNKLLSYNGSYHQYTVFLFSSGIVLKMHSTEVQAGDPVEVLIC